MIYELTPRYSSRKSFYGKAFIIGKGNILELQSYKTIVARITRLKNKTIYEYLGHYSMTTTTHQKEFFLQQGLSDKEVKELFKKGVLEYEF